jgi:dTDP-4-dehydrorhamnose 3,5-epimerase
MRTQTTEIDGVLILEPDVYADARGSFFESWERERYHALGLPADWVQDNVSHSVRGVLRGLHFQHPRGQHKLVSVISGEIFDVAVDIRRGSPTFGRWTAARLSGENHLQLSVAAGCAHGFLVLSDRATVIYKCSGRYEPRVEHILRWDDPELGIEWPMKPDLIAPKDSAGRALADFGPSELPGEPA